MTLCTGHSFIQHLLAKSVEKINALYPSSKNANVDEDGTITSSSKKIQLSEKFNVLKKQKIYEEKLQIKLKQYKMETEYTEYDAEDLESKVDIPDEETKKYIKKDASELKNKSNKKKRKRSVDGNVKKKHKKDIQQEELRIEIQNIKTEIKTENTVTRFNVPYTKVEVKEECSGFKNTLSSLKKIKDDKKIKEQKEDATFITENINEDNNDAEEDESCKIRKFRKRTTSNQVKKVFRPDEDEILRKAMEKFGDHISICSLAKELNRPYASVRDRITKIKTGDIRKKPRAFSLAEDLVIMDKVLDNLHGQTLAEINLHNDGESLEVATLIGRMEVSARNRWGNLLKPWILQHFSGTLNLDIRRMLANFLADNFDSTNSIDWQLVAERPDFVGHTRESVRNIFFTQLFPHTKNHLHLENKDITLTNIADYANGAYGDKSFRKISEKVFTRQKQVIIYFEQYVKQHGITKY